MGHHKIELRRTSDSELLGALVTCPQSKYIVIKGIQETGLIPSWNKSVQDKPERQVKAGDIIGFVNGVSGNSVEMMTEIKRPMPKKSQLFNSRADHQVCDAKATSSSGRIGAGGV